MSADDNFLSRWSRRKIQSRAGAAPPEPPATAAPPPHSTASPAASVPSSAPAAPGATPTPAEPAPKPLPPVESLTFDSDFSAFMQPGVDAVLRRTALKTLLNDPRFNVMDGLDVYIDDYSRPDPLPEGWIEKMNQYASLGDHEPGATPEAEDASVAQEPRGEGEPGRDSTEAPEVAAERGEGDPAATVADGDRQEPDTFDEGLPPLPQRQSPRDPTA